MKSKGLMTASFLLLLLCGVVWWSNKRAAIADKAPAESTTTKLVSIPEEQFREIEIKHRSGETVQLQRNDSKWQITAPIPLPADADAVSSMLTALSSLSSDRTVEEKTTSFDQYGLTQPTIELDIIDKNKKTSSLLIGDDTPAGTAVYAAIAGDPRVFALSSYKKSSLDKSTNDLRDKRLLTVESDKISRIQLVGKNETIEFGRNKEKWQILKPRPLRADGYQVDELVRKLTDARMDLSSSDQDPEKSFASGTMVATAKVTTESGTQEVRVRKNKDNYYAKSSVVEGMYKISSDLGQELGKNLDDFRNKKLFDFGFTNPNKIEIHDASKAYFLTRSGEDWWSGEGKKLDAGGVGSLVDKIRDLQASKFVDTGLGAPTVEITITSDDGKRIEKLLISKAGSSYVAKRENELALYALDSKAVEELQKSAGELKPAAAPGK